MNSKLFAVALAAALALPAVSLAPAYAAAPQKAGKGEGKKGKKGKKNAAMATDDAGAYSDPAPVVASDPASASAPVQHASAPAQRAQPAAAGGARQTAAAENDPQRTAWRIDVAPYLVLGSGHPGKAAADFDKPDGVAFTPNGYLLATDAKNRRVQIWDVKTNTRVGEFGHKFFGGEIVDIAVLPDGLVLVTDQTLNLAYAFAPPAPGAVDKDSNKPLGPADYQFKGTRFGEQGFDKLGGIAADSRNRVYCVDAHLNEVRRFNSDFSADPTWRFEKAKSSGDTYLHGCEGIAIDEATHSLYVSSEKDSTIQVFDSETGAYKRHMVGAGSDAYGTPTGKHVFFASVEGLTLARNHLLAVDESAGHIQIFDLGKPTVYNTDLVSFGTGKRGRQMGYMGFFGHSPLVDFEDKTNVTLQQQVKDESIIPGQANPPGYFCSPDSIASYTDHASGETYVAIADQCNYRVVVYRWSDIARAAGGPLASDKGQGSGAAGGAAGGGGGKGGKKGKKGGKL